MSLFCHNLQRGRKIIGETVSFTYRKKQRSITGITRNVTANLIVASIAQSDLLLISFMNYAASVSPREIKR